MNQLLSSKYIAVLYKCIVFNIVNLHLRYMGEVMMVGLW